MSDVYAFVFRGDMAVQAVGATGLALPAYSVEEGHEEIANALSLELLDPVDVEKANRMALVYVAIAAFERLARSFIRRVLVDEFSDDWWVQGVSERIRKKAEGRHEEEQKTKWHGNRGGDLLDYTEMGHLSSIIQQNLPLFEAHIPRAEWASAIFSAVEQSRNVIMHSGELGIEDIERVGVNIRDWSRQVGS
ncbi:Swt1 family HEPN domain-containing protein [Kribbella deserti]|uniref:Swt1 family HEPN domain-containing protein n=1 Tax=Kribbella deserti TaxID=1926257 RepID=A0ABV6QDU4_9ACTN